MSYLFAIYQQFEYSFVKTLALVNLSLNISEYWICKKIASNTDAFCLKQSNISVNNEYQSVWGLDTFR